MTSYLVCVYSCKSFHGTFKSPTVRPMLRLHVLYHVKALLELRNVLSVLLVCLTLPYTTELCLTVLLELGKEEKGNWQLVWQQSRGQRGSLWQEGWAQSHWEGTQLAVSSKAKPQACMRGKAAQSGGHQGPCWSLCIWSLWFIVELMDTASLPALWLQLRKMWLALLEIGG